MMTIRDIVVAWLKEHGYDGLCEEECGCNLNDIMPCNLEGKARCRAGKICNGPCENCYAEGEGEPGGCLTEDGKPIEKPA